VPKLAYKRFNQKTAAVAQRSSTDSDVNANNSAKCSGVKPVDDARHEHDAETIGKIIYRPFQDVSDHTVGHLALREQLLAAILAPPHYPSPIPRMVHLAESCHPSDSATARRAVLHR
jgi:hypothetical protein